MSPPPGAIWSLGRTMVAPGQHGLERLDPANIRGEILIFVEDAVVLRGLGVAFGAELEGSFLGEGEDAFGGRVGLALNGLGLGGALGAGAASESLAGGLHPGEDLLGDVLGQAAYGGCRRPRLPFRS